MMQVRGELRLSHRQLGPSASPGFDGSLIARTRVASGDGRRPVSGRRYPAIGSAAFFVGSILTVSHREQPATATRTGALKGRPEPPSAETADPMVRPARSQPVRKTGSAV